MSEQAAPLCPECDAEMVLRDGRHGPFWACSDPTCKATRDAKGRSIDEVMPSGRARENDKERWRQ